MADTVSMALDELLCKVQVSDDVDFLRAGVRALVEALMEREVTQHVGSGRYEGTPQRSGERKGTRERRWDRLGVILVVFAGNQEESNDMGLITDMLTKDLNNLWG